jgi:nicotinamide-nucleotide adenylyltransferase
MCGLRLLRGLLIGRYQPFHKGHLEVIKEALSKCDELIIGIGSAQESHTLENPFTVGERIEMIRRCLRKKDLARTIIVPISDVNRYAIWVSHVISQVPPFQVVFTNNPLTRSLFEEKGFKVISTKMYDRERYSGRKIRELMMKGGGWKDMVPKQILPYLKRLDARKRLMAASVKDE